MGEQAPNRDTRRHRLRRRRRRLERRLAEAVLERYGLRGARIEPLSLRFVQVFGVASRWGSFTLRLYDLPHGLHRAGEG
jgi:hypothetical protein